MRGARGIGVGQQLLGRWVGVERSRMDDPPDAPNIDERAELDRLRREVTELRMDRGFLKKATVPIVRMAELLRVSLRQSGLRGMRPRPCRPVTTIADPKPHLIQSWWGAGSTRAS